MQQELLGIVDGVTLYPYAQTEWTPPSGWPVPQLSQRIPVKTVEIWRCLFGVGYAINPDFAITNYGVYVSRSPLPGAPSWCTEGFIFAMNPNDALVPVVDIARHPFLPAIVYAYSSTSWDPILPPNSIVIRQVSVVSGATVHGGGLFPRYTYDTPYGPLYQRGGAMLESVTLDYFGTLTVTGRKSGSLDMYGEVGSGSRFTARYNYLIVNPEPSPAPTSVVAYE